MSLLQNVLRSQTTTTAGSDSLDKKFGEISLNRRSNSQDSLDRDDSDDELINVVSLPGTPPLSRSSSRPTSPVYKTTFARSTPEPSRPSSNDPLKIFPTALSQRIFSYLSIGELAICARVSKKWSKSQTINYVWFQHYRRENFHDQSLPLGKWTKRESKQNWRVLYLQAGNNRSPYLGPVNGGGSRGSSPSISGQQTPREIKEERWRLEAEEVLKPSKLEMRGMYKEMGGRKPKTKTKLGSSGGVRDKGGWEEYAGE